MATSPHLRRWTVATRPRTAPPRGLTLAVLCLSLLIVTLDNTVLNVALPTLVRDLGASSSQLQWVVDAYVLVFAGLLLVSGSLADRFGRQRAFLAGLVVFAAGSSWAAFSGSIGMLIAARAGMGIGGALIMPATLAIITDVFADEQSRQRAIGLWAGTSGAGVALGPIIGGLLLTRFWWGSIFLINVPIALAGAVLALRLVPDSKSEQPRRPDQWGALASIAGLGLLLFAIIEAPVHGWDTPRGVATLAGGVLVLTAFVVWERACAHPMLELRFFRQRRFSIAVVSGGLISFALFGSLFLLTQFLQFGLGYSPLQAGLRMLPAAGAVAVVAPLSSLLVRALGSKLPAALGLSLAACGLWLAGAAGPSSGYGDEVPWLVLIGVGVGLVLPTTTGAVMGSLPREHTGVGSATNGTFMQVGGALGVAVIGSLLADRYQGRLAAAAAYGQLPATLHRQALGSVGGALELAERLGAHGGALATAARAAFLSGFDLGLQAAAPLALAGALLVLAGLPARAGQRRRRSQRTAR